MRGLDKYWKNIFSVLAGSAFAQLFPIFGSLLIARLFSPSDFGIYSVWLGIATTISIVMSGRLERSLVNERDGFPRRIAVQFVVLTILTGAALCGVGLFVYSMVSVHLNMIIMTTPMMLLALATSFLIALTQLWQSWAAADGNYGALSKMRIAIAIFVVTLQISIGFLMPSAETIAIAHTAGLAIGFIVSLRLMPLCILFHTRALVSTTLYWKRHSKFIFYSLPAGTVSTIAGHMPIFIISSRFGPEHAGFLALTMRVLGAPTALLGKAILDVFKRSAAVSFKQYGQCKNEYLKTLRVLMVGGVGLAVGIYFLSDILFVSAFGEKWEPSAMMAVWLIPIFSLRFVASPLTYIVYITNHQHIDLIWQILFLFMSILTLTLINRLDDTILIYSLLGALSYCIYLVISYNASLGRLQSRHHQIT